MTDTAHWAQNSPATYGAVTKTFHWLTALLILTAIPLGLVANALPYETSAQLEAKFWLFSLHKTVGVAAFFVALARILWALTQPKPGLLNADKRVESWAAETVHWLLYASMLIVPLSGWIHHAATSGFAPIWWPFGQNLPLVPKSEALAQMFAAFHLVFTKVLGLAIFLHVAGALKHHLIDRDDTLRRMLPGRTVPDLPQQHHSAVPLAAATGIYALAIGLGVALGMGKAASVALPAPAVSTNAPAENAGWIVEQGRLGLTVTQGGSDMTGSFADWSAQIAYDPTSIELVVGTVDVTINVGSLQLGGVTSEALGADFLAAETHPTANFTADLIATGFDGEAIAEGTLTLVGQAVPLSMPVTITVDGDLAQATGVVLLDRRDFGIGLPGHADEATVGFEVEVAFDITARQAE